MGMMKEFTTISIVLMTCLILTLILELELAAASDKCPLEVPPTIANATVVLLHQEEIVRSIASFALLNYQNIAELTASCDDQTNCSRLVCNPLRRDLNELTCEAVPNNVDCVGPNDAPCSTALFSNERSYIRYSAQLTLTQAPRPCDVVAMTCAQRLLDSQVFIPTSNRTTFTLLAWSYFGSNNGIQRIYPGKELNSTTCKDYDIRKRPWYVAVTAIQKKVVVLLDTGPSMGYPLSPVSGTAPLFGASRAVTVEFLDTLSSADEVSVLTFGGSDTATVISITDGPVTVNGSDQSSKDDSNLNPLRASIMSANNGGIPDPQFTSTDLATDKANLTAGLLKALDQFDQFSPTLNAIIIITAGDFIGTDLPPSLVESMAAKNVRVFMYRFLDTSIGSNDGNDVISTQLLNISCHINGTYEENYYDALNPLGTIQSFYSYVASLRYTLSGGQNMTPIWVPKYLSASGIGYIVTAAYPVFDNDSLLGVAGVDLLIDTFQQTAADVNSAVQARNTWRSLAVNVVPPIVTSSCSQPLVQTPSNCPSATTNSNLTGICDDTDTSKSQSELAKERLCCDGCCNITRDGNSPSAGQIAGISVGSVVGALVLGVCGCAIYLTCVSGKKGNVRTRNQLANDPDQPSEEGERQRPRTQISDESTESSFFDQIM